jgi:hypothetical protein
LRPEHFQPHALGFGQRNRLNLDNSERAFPVSVEHVDSDGFPFNRRQIEPKSEVDAPPAAPLFNNTCPAQQGGLELNSN